MGKKPERSETEKYLQQMKYMDRLIKCKLQEIAELEEVAVSLGVHTEGERVQTSNCSDKTSECAIRLADLKMEALELCRQWAQLKTEVNRILNHMSTRQYMIILNMYFCQNKTFGEIADFMGFSYQWTYQLYKRALAEFENTMNEIGSCEH